MTAKQISKIKKPNKKILFKYLRHTANISILVSTAAIASTAIVFTRLSHHKEDLQLIFKNFIGLEIDYSKLDSGFTATGMPFLKIDNLILSSAVNKSRILKLSNLDMILSYRSILSFAPIFNKLQINNSSLYLTLEKNDDITLNGVVISNLNDEGSDINLGYLVNQQGSIDITNINVSFKDNKHNFKPLSINDYTLHFNHDGQYARQLTMSAKIKDNQFISKLEYDGLDTFDYRTWVNGKLSINAMTPHGYRVSINSLVVDHQIDYIKANLDSNDNVFTSYSNNFGDITAFKGNINVLNNGYNKYTVAAKNLLINTNYGYLFNNASIVGNIDLENGGSLDIKNVKLNGITGLINYMAESTLLNLSGNLNATNIYWFGNIRNPKNISLNSSISNVNLTSYNESIPSFTNLSGKINSTLDHGEITLSLNNSKITANKYLYQPININSFNSTINWQKESESWMLTWKDSTFVTPDFTVKSSGSYHDTHNHLIASAVTKSINLSQIYKYLPNSLDKYTISSLKNDISGYINNLQININGDINNIPFKESDNVNKLNLKGELNNISYNVINDYPKLENIHGKFQLDKNTILNLSGNGNIAKMSISAHKIQIPNIMADSPIIVGSVVINGSTNNLLQSINETPYKKDIEQLLEKISVTGDGKTIIDLKVPINNPEKATVTGKHLLQNNEFSFNGESSSISNVNAIISFTQKGLTSGKAQGVVLDSIFDANITPKSININFPQLNYSALINKTAPALESTIEGASKTSIEYNIDNNIVKINSNLQGVYINIPDPIGKSINDIRDLSVIANISNKNIQAYYSNIITSNVNLEDNFSLKNLNVNIGEPKEFESSTQYKTNININLDNIYIHKWLAFINQVSDKLAKTTAIKLESQIQESESYDDDNHIFPVNININSDAFWFNNYNFNGGSINATIYPHELVTANINTPDVNGKIGYSASENNLSIDLKRLLISVENNIQHPNQTAAQVIAVATDESNIVLTNVESIHNIESSQIINNEHILPIKNIESNNHESSVILSKKIQLPDILISIENLYLNNAFLGSVKGNIVQQSNDLYLENITLNNASSSSHLNGFMHCLFCDNNTEDKMAAINMHTNVKNFGQLATKFNQGDMFKGGNGSININAYYDGNLLDFKKQNLTLYSNINIENGTLLKVKPGIVGTFMGVVSLGAISSVNSLNFNNLFGQSFQYKNLISNFKIHDNTVSVANMTLNGDSAFIKSFGKYYIDSQQIDAYLTVEPKMGATIATTAGVVTLNPIIGGLVYFAQKLIGDPINKLLAVNFKITGDIHSPEIKPTELNEQILNNFKSSVQFMPIEEDN
ncbi:MAG: DUF3971 domain-containing protein [Burkholderiales bacterium]|nr:DUF3971 domain-containing protein [Burkholderiales bacterium]